jgi:hypothetical protein
LKKIKNFLIINLFVKNINLFNLKIIMIIKF